MPLLLSFFTLVGLAEAQERLPRAEAVQLATVVNFDLDQLADTPIPTDADTKRPFGIRERKRGGIVIPEAKLARATLAGAGKDVVPIGQLWLHKIALLRKGQPVSEDQLKLVHVTHEGRELRLPLCVLGARKAEAGALELLIYGKTKEPLLTLPLRKVESQQELPLEFTTAPEAGNTASVTLKILGQYEATFSVMAQEAE